MKQEYLQNRLKYRISSHNTILLLNKSATCFFYCFFTIIRPIPRIQKEGNHTVAIMVGDLMTGGLPWISSVTRYG
jgi:hypothetical protein